MGWPEKQAVVVPAAAGPHWSGAGAIRSVQLLGHKGKLQWAQDDTGLKVQMPAEKPCDHAVALKISGY